MKKKFYGLPEVRLDAGAIVRDDQRMNPAESSCPIHKVTLPKPDKSEVLSPKSSAQLREALHASEERNRAILDTAVTAIITMNEECIIDGVNAAAERLFGYTKEEMVGNNVKMLMPSPYHDKHDGFVKNYLQTGEKRIIGIGREVVARRKDGSVFPMDLSVGEVNLPKGRFFTGIIRDITDRKELEEKILEISEEEQNRIGQDIHDDLCQQLAAIGCLAKVAHTNLKRTNDAEAESLAEIVRLVSQANARAREMSRGLVPVVLDSAGLMSALEELARGTERIFGISCTFDCDPPVEINDNKLAVQLYRIAQEAVGNAIKHSRADQMQIDLSFDDGNIVLGVRDNGTGIPDHALRPGTGMGLLTMNHRAKMLGGTVTVRPDSLGGTEVVCVVPQVIRNSTQI
ncbi:PAS domain S-box protein [Phragmitibacter flavus]|uniref:Oxygen sensor histidine kinase NreB n=1 Tax=Phragmitibacter flavus TaxID=2576071 RepID=A0A5R8KAG6_9BACT|nr:PAS domain S-box protein [Phragmitibacter flavus]TLD69308.1 PAS domain S-box protein [Phragmitibacter flavus]